MTDTYTDRLAAARRAIAETDGFLADYPVPLDLADQLGAAARDSRALVRAIGKATGLRESSYPRDEATTRELRARTLAAMEVAEFRSCWHLREQPAQETIIRLALRRADCRLCVRTAVKPPPEDDRTCDWCQRGGVTTFVPTAYACGAWAVIGDACAACAAALGATQAVSA